MNEVDLIFGIPEKHLNADEQRVKRNYPNSAMVYKYIATKLAEAEDIALFLMRIKS